MMRRRANLPQSVMQNTSNILDWSTQVPQMTNKRGSTRGASVGNPLNQTHANISSFKNSGSKLSGIQGILSKVPNHVTGGKSGSVDQKQNMSRSMNVQEILNQQSMDPKRLKSNQIN